MSFLSQVANVFTGSEDAKVRKKAGRIQQEQAIQQADMLRGVSEQAVARFDPLASVGQKGIDLAGFLANPQAQADFAQSNPLFQIGLDRLTGDINQSAAARGRLTAGDTLEQLSQSGMMAAQPLIDKQRQDILNLLGIYQGAAGAQGNIDLSSAGSIADLLTGGAAAKAAGVVGAQDARTAATGNILDVAMMAARKPPTTGSVGTQPIIPPGSTVGFGG